jgi:hypothetical protein
MLASRGQAERSEIVNGRGVPVMWVGHGRQPSRQQRPLRPRSRSGSGAIGQANCAVQATARRWSAEDEVMGQPRTRITTHPPIAPPTLDCPKCRKSLAYHQSFLSGIERIEQWDRIGVWGVVGSTSIGNAQEPFDAWRAASVREGYVRQHGETEGSSFRSVALTGIRFGRRSNLRSTMHGRGVGGPVLLRGATARTRQQCSSVRPRQQRENHCPTA